MAWIQSEFQRARTRSFIRALEDAKRHIAALPEHRRLELERQFQEAQEAARRHAGYQRPGA